MVNNKNLIGAALFGLAVGCGPAQAAIDWNFSSAGCQPTTTDTSTATTRANTSSATCTAGGITVTATAWANTAGTTNRIERAILTPQGSSGLGVTNLDGSSGDSGEGTNPEHAIDNNDRTDGVLFVFSAPVALAQVALGWYSNDSDFSLLAYNGAGPLPLSGLFYGDLVGAGWTAIGDYFDTHSSTNDASAPAGSAPYTANVNAGGVVSSTWLVTAFNSVFGAPDFGANVKTGSDYFKLLSLKGTTPPPPPPPGVSEPGVLSLLAAGLVGVGLRRRRLLKRAA